MKWYSIHPSVHLSVRPSVSVCQSVYSIRPLQQCAAGLLLWARWVKNIYLLLHGRRHHTTTRSGKGG